MTERTTTCQNFSHLSYEVNVAKSELSIAIRGNCGISARNGLIAVCAGLAGWLRRGAIDAPSCDTVAKVKVC